MFHQVFIELSPPDIVVLGFCHKTLNIEDFKGPVSVVGISPQFVRDVLLKSAGLERVILQGLDLVLHLGQVAEVIGAHFFAQFGRHGILDFVQDLPSFLE